MGYKPNSRDIDLVALAVSALFDQPAQRGVILEDFCAGVAKGLSDVLDDSFSDPASERADELRATVVSTLVDDHAGFLGEFHGNSQRIH